MEGIEVEDRVFELRLAEREAGPEAAEPRLGDVAW